MSLVAIAFGLVQIRQIKQSREAEVRPYVSVRYDCDTSGEKSRVFLEFTNHGRTPACNVQLNFQGKAKWHHVSAPDYPFTGRVGIARMQPGESLRYFVGELGTSSDFDKIKSEVIDVVITYGTVFTEKKIVETVQLTLSHLKFSKSLTPKAKSKAK